jgi:ABC-type amino acid transport substrate-binding protein
MPENIHIAVLYAEADSKYWHELERHINLLTKMHRNVRIWTVMDIELGRVVSQEIRDELRRADITLLLLSADFAYEKIFDEETRILLDAYARRRNEKRFIMPIIVKDFLWRDHYDDNFDIEKLKFFDKIVQGPEEREKVYKEIAERLNSYIAEINSETMHFIIPTWVGYIGGIMYNNGFVRSDKTGLFQKYKRKLNFSLNDETDEVCNAWLAGEAHLIWSTIDRLPYILNRLKDRRPRILFQASWSNGADAIIARGEIKKVADLKGKRVAYPYGTPAHTFLKHVLNENGMDMFDIAHIPQKQTDLDQITKSFINDPAIDAVVLWSPYIEACLDEAPKSKIIAHTGRYPNLIADVVVASKDFIDLNREELSEFFKGWLEHIHRFVKEKSHQKDAVEVLINAILQPLPSIIPSRIRESLVESLNNYFEQSLKKVHLCTYEDNLRFFGIRTDKPGEGEALYKHFLNLLYPELAKNIDMQWDTIVDPTVLELIAPEEK